MLFMQQEEQDDSNARQQVRNIDSMRIFSYAAGFLYLCCVIRC
jgi:hypothetical protein